VRISDGTSGSLLATARLRPTADDESVAAMTFGLEVDPEELHVRLTTSPLDPVPPRSRRTVAAPPTTADAADAGRVPPTDSASADAADDQGTRPASAAPRVPVRPWWRRLPVAVAAVLAIVVALVLLLLLTGSAADDDGAPGETPGAASDSTAATGSTDEPGDPASTAPVTTAPTTTAAPATTTATTTAPPTTTASAFPTFGGPTTYGVVGPASSAYSLSVEGISVATSGGEDPLVLSIVEQFQTENAFNEVPITDATGERVARDTCAGTAVGLPASGGSGEMHDRTSEILLRFVPLEASQDNRFNAPLVRLDAPLDSTRSDAGLCRTVPLRDGILWTPITVTRSAQRVEIYFPAGMAPGAYWLEMRTPDDVGIIPTAPITIRVAAPS
jgi:hypothetical protein